MKRTRYCLLPAPMSVTGRSSSITNAKRRKDLTQRAQRSDTEFAEKKERNLFALRGGRR
jgi:hypothetical protein